MIPRRPVAIRNRPVIRAIARKLTLLAAPSAPDRAAKKSNRQLQYLLNKIARAANGSAPVVLGCAQLAERPEYRRRYAEVQRRFEIDAPFKRACLDTTRWVLAASPGDKVDERAALLGVHYLLAELPMFLHAPEVTGRSEVAFVYHQCPQLVVDLYAGRFGDVVSTGQGFVEVTDD
jgi:tRNA-dependent cyclodipeptide synthase